MDECIYCGREQICDGVVPEVDDYEGWVLIGEFHEQDCEWVITRAHRYSIGVSL